jgi:hypothetical protein
MIEQGGRSEGPQVNPPPDSTLPDPQQTVADLRQELAQRTAELNESEAQKTAMAEVLWVINASPGDLAPVFDAMLEKALASCNASFGQLVTCIMTPRSAQ